MFTSRAITFSLLLSLTASASAQEGLDATAADVTPTPVDTPVAPPLPERPYAITEDREPCDNYTALRKPHFGDFHVHTALSFDANTQDTRNLPIDAYNFAKGGAMGIQPYDENDNPQRTIQLDRPLDFTAVTDHAEFMGEVRMCSTRGLPGYWHPVCLLHRHRPQMSFLTFGAAGLSYKNRWGFCGDNAQECLNVAASVWEEVQAANEAAYDRSSDCTFTSFNGYEWTASAGTGENLHHNVVFKNETVPDYALGWIESPSQVALWDYLDSECVEAKPGCDAVVIPHNSNLSGALMFETAYVNSLDIPAGEVTAEEAKRRAHWNTLFELMQHKGSSECDSRLPIWSEDEYCGFEKMGYDRFGGKNTGDLPLAELGVFSFFLGDEMTPETVPPTEANFLRYALKKGLKQQEELGANSFKFGLISSTDTHIAAPGLTMEKNHPGHGGAGMGARDGVPIGLPDELEYSPGGLAVLYAEENTRDSLFAAMRRREAYATSGTRPIVRFFGGWDYPAETCESADMVATGYAGGVPMGGDLAARPGESGNPRFILSASMDNGTPEYPGSPLDRIQLIKGWYEDGELYEKVLDVAGGDREASVDLQTCEQSGSGHAQLCTVWEDTDFDAGSQAFYYTRVLETPSCRWSQRICAEANVQCDDPSSIPEGMENCCAPEHRKVIKERAWSSPIWYTPPT